MMENIKWLFFDMGGVILNDEEPERIRQATLFQVARRYIPNLSMQDIYTAWMEASKVPGVLRINAVRALFKNSPSLAEVEEEFVRTCKYDYHAMSSIRPEAKGVLAELSKHYKLGVMANQSEKTLKLLEVAGLLPYLSHQKMSAHIGFAKPDPDFYRAVLEDTQAKPAESVLIDDNWYRGLLSAKKLGVGTVLFKREIMPWPEDAAPDFMVSKLEELVGLFGV